MNCGTRKKERKKERTRIRGKRRYNLFAAENNPRKIRGGRGGG
jgi:hypothetical protein